jgi:nucleoside-diphosphate-sugar epimerase
VQSKTALVLGGGGFIGSHLVNRLKREGFWVRAVDLKLPEFSTTQADDFVKGNLRDPVLCREVIDRQYTEIYQLAADMGGAGFVFTGENDADIMHNSALINTNVLDAAQRRGSKRIFYSSSACMYPAHNQEDPDNPNCAEDSAYPANPDSEYGWEKLFSERLYLAFARNYGFQVRIARYHNIFGPKGTWNGGREKAPAAICRKVAEVDDGGEIEVWGDGSAIRSYTYVDDMVDGIYRLTQSELEGAANIGCPEYVTVDQLVETVAAVAGKRVKMRHVDGPVGVHSRNFSNGRIESLGWRSQWPLRRGIEATYPWIAAQVEQARSQ